MDNEKMQALELALMNEKKEKEFYLMHAGRTNDPLGRAMFNSIAGEEGEHYNRLLELHGKMEERERWPDDFSVDISASKVREILDGVIGAAASPAGGDEEDVEAVKIAIAFESKGEKFYDKMAAGAGNDRERHFFSLLASMERDHRLSLEDTLAYFEDPKGWLQMKGREL